MSGSISVLVVCRDAGRTLEATLDAIRRQTRSPEELVVVDARSTDLYTIQVLARLQRAGIRATIAATPESSGVWNAGARLTSGDYIVRLNGNCVLDPDYFARTSACLDAHPEADFVCDGADDADRAEGDRVAWEASWLDALATGVVPPLSTMLRRKLWLAVGGYDEALSSCAELDFWVSALHGGARGFVLGGRPFDAVGGNGVGRRWSSSGADRQVRMPNERWGPTTRPADLRRLYQKHRGVVESVADDLGLRKDAFIRCEAERRRHLDARQAALEQDLGALRVEIDVLSRLLLARGAHRVDWGDLRRSSPLSGFWGSDRGKPVNRYYIDKFLAEHSHDITGHVLEVKDSGYTERFGHGVVRKEVLDIDPANARATITADLAQADSIPSDTFDCFVLTQVLNVIWDTRGALSHAMRILRPGGTLLCTVASLDRMSYEQRGVDGDYWRFTEASLRALLGEVCPLDHFEVTTYGNVMTCVAHLYGLAAEELDVQELDPVDPAFPLIVASRAVKPAREEAARGV